MTKQGKHVAAQLCALFKWPDDAVPYVLVHQGYLPRSVYTAHIRASYYPGEGLMRTRLAQMSAKLLSTRSYISRKSPTDRFVRIRFKCT
jgi:hypothetical protein